MVTCALPVAVGVVLVSLLGYGILWIASGLPDAIETGICLLVGFVTAVVAAPAEAAGVDDVMLYGLVAGVSVAAFVGRWQLNVMFTRAATHGLAFAGLLILLAPYLRGAPQSPTGDLGTGHFILASIVEAFSEGVVTVVLGLGFGCG